MRTIVFWGSILGFPYFGKLPYIEFRVSGVEYIYII